MRLHVEQAQFENGEQSARARTNNQHIGFDRFAHIASFRLDALEGESGKEGVGVLAKGGGSGKP